MSDVPSNIGSSEPNETEPSTSPEQPLITETEVSSERSEAEKNKLLLTFTRRLS